MYYVRLRFFSPHSPNYIESESDLVCTVERTDHSVRTKLEPLVKYEFPGSHK